MAHKMNPYYAAMALSNPYTRKEAKKNYGF